MRKKKQRKPTIDDTNWQLWCLECLLSAKALIELGIKKKIRQNWLLATLLRLP